MSLAKLLSDTLFELGRAAWRFSRKRTEIEQLREAATWNANHMGCAELPHRCVVCGNAPVRDDRPCPGPRATQRARAKLAALERRRGRGRG